MFLDWVAEPFDGGMSLPGMWEAAVIGRASQAWVASAWLRVEGLEQISVPLSTIAKQGSVRFLVGRSFGGTTFEAVEQACQISRDVRLFHDPEGRIFHPKVFLACSQETAWLLVGSQNLTGGGVKDNFEASLYVRCAVSEPIVGQVIQWFDRLAAPGRAVPVTLESLRQQCLPAEAHRRKQQEEQRQRERVAAVADGAGEGGQSFFTAPPMTGLRSLSRARGTDASGASAGANRPAARASEVREVAPEHLSRECPPPRSAVAADPDTSSLWEQVHAGIMGLDPDLGWHYSSPDSAERRTYYFPGARDGRLWFLSGARGYVVVNCYRPSAWQDIREQEGLPPARTNYGSVRVTDLDDRLRVINRIYRRLRFGG